MADVNCIPSRMLQEEEHLALSSSTPEVVIKMLYTTVCYELRVRLPPQLFLWCTEHALLSIRAPIGLLVACADETAR